MKAAGGTNRAKEYLMVAALALLGALNYHVFIFANDFAPAGINGLATMVQYLFDFSVGYMSLLINIPLCIFAFFTLDRDYACKTLVFSLSFSLGLLLLRYCTVFDVLVYHTDNGTSLILAPVAAGAVYGVIYGLLFRVNGSTGGTDVVAAYIHRFFPDKDTLWIILALNSLVAALSYFVYNLKIEPVILCIIYCYMNTRVGDHILRGGKEAVKFEVVTDEPEALSALLMDQLRHGVTLLPATGMYSHNSKGLLICVVNKHQVVDFVNLIRSRPNTFACASSVTQTVGNFKMIKRVRHEPSRQ